MLVAAVGPIVPRFPGSIGPKRLPAPFAGPAEVTIR
jgi:hypothetical protein